ncbi:MAG: EAL domain-containing protein [Gammaproteobacteria bacterium]|nr:EAL domain-containing protein [Gammaproteobacteria bacterium]
MVANAETPADAPEPLNGTTLDPYGQLLKMLLPRAHSIVVYDGFGVPIWASADNDDIELQALQQHALAAELAEPGVMGAGFAEAMPGEQVAYLFLLRNGAGELLGSVGLASRESSRDPRPFALVHGLLRPALQCLERELASQSNIGTLQRSLVVRDRDLELLLGAAHEESEGGNSTDDFAKLVQGCVDHLGCAFGALLIPDKNIAVCRTAADTPPRVGAEILTRTHRQLLGWGQLHRHTMTSNAPQDSGPFASIPYKILACPVMHGAQRVQGVLVLFKTRQAPDFDLRQVRIVELLGRRVAYILLNSYDPATGLLTRPAFEKRANAMLTPQALQKDNCVIYVDIDRLHVLNESLGMHVGDSVIVRVAEVIRQSLAPRMLASRISGDRFAIFVPESSIETTHEIADNLRLSFERLGFLRERQQVEVTASFGVANVVHGNHPLSHALASAEIACKAAKDRGRNRVETYFDGDQSIVRRYTDLTLIGTVRSALLDHRFRLEAQTVVPFSDAPATPKFELLLRMNDEKGESIPPERFLSAAERYQVAPAIDRWVVRRTIELLAPHAARLHEMRACFAVNISGQSLGDADFAVFMDTALRGSKLPRGLLSFEVTETAAVANIVRAEALIRRLRDLGSDVALDDFGRGLSSLTYLKTLPVTHLKIDGIFVRDVVTDDRSQAMLSAIVQLARAMKLKTVAECVESEAIWQATRALGVDYGQGFYIGRPMPLEKVLGALVGATIGRSADTKTA